ncbi:MAG: membrane protein insertion efficiency factor YidD [Chlamydiales bacterium]|nr:membrane protein insertion efficiency factor YidD [Chlamydiales bacterium]
MKTHLLIILLLQTSIFANPCFIEPWGKDASLVHPAKKPCCKPNFPLTSLGEALIRFHQNVISPIDGPRSHYRPSSSQYAMDAIRTYGFFPGIALGCDRLLRENSDPWIYDKVPFDGTTLKWDPVEGTRSWFKDSSSP